MGIISIEQADWLYWLGRYTERAYTSIRIFAKSYDDMIDAQEEDCYQDYCRQVAIPNIYESREDFLTRYPFDAENEDSIIGNLNRAYDNAIILRESIGTEALSYIQLAIYEMNKGTRSKAPMLELQKVLDDILAFWGAIDDRIDSEETRNIIKAGKRIERIDIYARLRVNPDKIRREVHRMIPRVERSGLPFAQKHLDIVKELAEIEDLDYYRILYSVENIL